jgi:serine/threonine protein kinase/photosystem II stability/assembly factor-like uncharacterized protein
MTATLTRRRSKNAESASNTAPASPHPASPVDEPDIPNPPPEITVVLPREATPMGDRSSGWVPPSVEEMQRMLPAYDMKRLLGRGGMGAVYEGVQRALERPAAIKVLPPDVAARDPHFVERFKRESRAMAKLAHPNIVAVYEAGETIDGLLYFVMELIDGVDVARMIDSEGALPPNRVLRICRDVCDALMYAHAQGIVHRDVTPSNIIIDRQGRVKVADFGLAKLEDPNRNASSTVMGKPDFVPPEAFVPGIEIDGRADVYALGVSLYQMLTGRLPKGRFELPSHLVPGVDARLDAIIDKAMQTDRERRYSSAAEVRSALEVIMTHSVSRSLGVATSGQTLPLRTGTLSVRVPGTSPEKKHGGWSMEKVALASAFAALAGVAMILGTQVWPGTGKKNGDGQLTENSLPPKPSSSPFPLAPLIRPRGTWHSNSVSIPVQTSSIRSKSQIQWRWRNPLPQGSSLMDVLWDGTRFIAVGDRSAMVTSTDGFTWERLGNYDVPWLGGIASSGSSYVACGAGFLNRAPLLFSKDGQTWTRLMFQAPDLEAVTWTGKEYVAVGRAGTIAVSRSGDSEWSRLAAGNSRFYGIASNHGTTVVVGTGGSIVSSDNATRWMARESGVSENLAGITWADSRWVVVGDAGTVLVSTDAIRWERRKCATSQNLQTVCWTGGRLVAAGTSGTAWISEDGEMWQPVASGTPQNIQAIQKGHDGTLVAMCDRGMVLSSSDEGMTWRSSIRSVTQNMLLGIAASPDHLVSVGEGGVILRSEDGVRWEAVNSGTSTTLNRVAWAGDQFIAVGFNGTILTSGDGMEWHSTSTGLPQPLWAVAGNGKRHVVVGDEGVIVTSEDGRAWAECESNSDEDLLAVTWAGNEFVAVGGNGLMLRSSDGTHWNSVPTPLKDDFMAVTWTGSQIIAVGLQDRALSTSDFITWKQGRLKLFAGRATSVLWHEGLVLAVGAFGSCAVSADLENWLGSGSLVEATGNDLEDACIFRGKVIAVGEAGTILEGDWFGQTPDFSQSQEESAQSVPQTAANASMNGPPPQALNFGGSRYAFVRQRTTWTGAKQIAEAMGGHLATITSQAENDWLRQAIPPGVDAVALGGELNKDGRWTWITGEPWAFTAWARTRDGSTSEPNSNGADKLEWISYEPTYKPLDGWNDIFDTESLEIHPTTRAFLVEWDAFSPTQ